MKDNTRWMVLPDHQGHEINNLGQIRHISKGNILDTSVNQTGVAYASLRNTKLGKYETRAVGSLVASAFCTGRDAAHDTVLHLNGDTTDCSADNLMWTSRWHAISYHKEIRDVRYQKRYRVQSTDGGPIYKSLLEVAMLTGCLPSAIDYCVRYNDQLAVDSHSNTVHKLYPGGYSFRSA